MPPRRLPSPTGSDPVPATELETNADDSTLGDHAVPADLLELHEALEAQRAGLFDQ